MTDPMRDAERLAAMLDGRVDERERARLLALLAASEIAFDAVVDAAAVRADVADAEPLAAQPRSVPAGGPPVAARPDAAERVTAVVSPRAARAFGGWRARAALAAGVAAIALAATLLLRGPSSGAENPHAIASLLAQRAHDAAAWQPGAWGSTRAAGDPLTVDTRAVRLGALLVGLTVADRESRPEAGAIAADVAALIAAVPAGGPLAAHYARIAERPVDASNRTLLAEGAAALGGLVPVDWLRAGAWLESARVAAAARDEAFLRRPETAAAMRDVRALRPLPDAAAVPLERVDALLAAPLDHAAAWSALEAALAAALAALAG
jgi:hypothetical protein